MLVSIRQETAYRPHECPAVNGADFEIYRIDKGRGFLYFGIISRLPEYCKPKYVCMFYLFIYFSI